VGTPYIPIGSLHSSPSVREAMCQDQMNSHMYISPFVLFIFTETYSKCLDSEISHKIVKMPFIKTCLFITVMFVVGYGKAIPLSADDTAGKNILRARDFFCGDGLCVCTSGSDFLDCESSCC